MIRFFDIVFSMIGLILLSPLFMIFYLMIRLESKGGGFYTQERMEKMVYHSDFTNSGQCEQVQTRKVSLLLAKRTIV